MADDIWYLHQSGENVFGDTVFIESRFAGVSPYRVRELYKWPHQMYVRTMFYTADWLRVERYKTKVGFKEDRQW